MALFAELIFIQIAALLGGIFLLVSSSPTLMNDLAQSSASLLMFFASIV